jgi:predicted DCC family thiol-disulfide oxidoreductase YuxK
MASWEWESKQMVLLYDGVCALCQNSVAWLQKRDKNQQIAYVPLQTPGVLDRLGVTQEEAYKHIHAFDATGCKKIGADAVLWAVSILPGYGWLPWLWVIPGMKHTSRWIYGQIAKRRYWFNI